MATAKQTCDPIQKSLGWCEGRPQYAGMRRRIWYTSRSNVLSFPRVPLDAMGRPTSSDCVGEFKLKEGAFFYYIDIVPERSQMTSEAQGDYPSQTSLDKINAVHAGVGPEASALAAYCHNTNNVYVVQDVSGDARLIGIEDAWPVKSTVAMDFGQGPSGTASTTLAVEGTNKVPFPHYKGKIPTEDGEISFGMQISDITPGN